MPNQNNPPIPDQLPPTPGPTNEFLNPKSMLTPGIAGGIVMLISQALSNAFQSPLAITAIVLSFLVGLLVFIATSIPVWQRIVFYLLNSLIIFSVAVGASAAASNRPSQPQQTKAMLEQADAQIKTLDAKIIAVDDAVKKLPPSTTANAQKQVNETKTAAKNVEKTVSKANKDVTRELSKTFKFKRIF